MECLLFLFRHGETDWNRAGRLQGHTDTPLNAIGLAQAEALTERLRPEARDAHPRPGGTAPLRRRPALSADRRLDPRCHGAAADEARAAARQPAGEDPQYRALHPALRARRRAPGDPR